MKSVFLLSLIVAAVYGVSPKVNADELNISMGKTEIESITLKTLKVKKKKTIFVLAYTSPKHGTFVREVPKKFFTDIYAQAKKWNKTFSKGRQTAAASVAECARPLDINIDKKKNILCLDHSSARERKKFFSWFNEQAQLAMIVIR